MKTVEERVKKIMEVAAANLTGYDARGIRDGHEYVRAEVRRQIAEACAATREEDDKILADMQSDSRAFKLGYNVGLDALTNALYAVSDTLARHAEYRELSRKLRDVVLQVRLQGMPVDPTAHGFKEHEDADPE